MEKSAAGCENERQRTKVTQLPKTIFRHLLLLSPTVGHLRPTCSEQSRCTAQPWFPATLTQCFFVFKSFFQLFSQTMRCKIGKAVNNPLRCCLPGVFSTNDMHFIYFFAFELLESSASAMLRFRMGRGKVGDSS